MFNIPYFWIGFVVVVFIISVTLMIFAPRSINFYPYNVYPIIKYIHENNTDVIKSDLQKIKNLDKLDTNHWIKWPDKKLVKNEYIIYPLYMFSVVSKSRKLVCDATYKLIKNIPDVKTCTFLKIGSNSAIKKHKKWKELSNESLSCLFILEAPMASINDCGIWINGETKKISKNKMFIFDSSKEHSIFNSTDYPIYGLLLDVGRPKNIPNGASDTLYSDEIFEFINKLKSKT
jgi:aspartyl/asparaginyl beta-hydroxylase (cupin superfamily)